MKKVCSILLLFFSLHSFGQTFLLRNEEIIYSFDTKKGKHLTLAKDTANKYIVYRFGTKGKVEFEFPEKNESSWTKFKYSFYLRGGGVQNEGQDLNYITFTNKDVEYIIYDTYYSIGEIIETGIKVTNLTTKKTTDIKGDHKTRKGTMSDFRDSGLLEITEPEE